MRYLILLSLLSIVGCTTVRYTGAPIKRIKVDYPKLGDIAVANLGDHFVKKGDVLKVKVLSLDREIHTGGYYIPKGLYTQIGSDMVNDYFSGDGITVINGASVKSLAVKRGGEDKIMLIAEYGLTLNYDARFKILWRMTTAVNNFQQVLVYKGRVGDRVKIGYREFTNNRIRSAFSNDIEYDLSASKMIGYKGARLEVLKADNVSITYKLISNFK